eukprot:Gb_33501 [translate_table: standard]
MDTTRLHRTTFSLLKDSYNSPVSSSYCSCDALSSVTINSRPCSRFPLILTWRKRLSGSGGFNVHGFHTRRRRRKGREIIQKSQVTEASLVHNFAAIAFTVAAITLLPLFWRYVKNNYLRSKPSSSPNSSDPQRGTEDLKDMAASANSNAEFPSRENVGSVDKTVTSQPQFSNSEVCNRHSIATSSNESDHATALAVSDGQLNESNDDCGAMAPVAAGCAEQKQEMELASKDEFSGLEGSVVNAENASVHDILRANEVQEPGLELPFVKKSTYLENEHQDIGAGHQIVIADTEQVSGLESCIVGARSSYSEEEAQDMGSGQKVIANEKQELGLQCSLINGKRSFLEEEPQDLGTIHMLVTANEVQETHIVNEKSRYSEEGQDIGAGQRIVITNDVQGSSSMSCGMSLAIEEPYLLENLSSTRERDSVENIFVPRTTDSHINKNSNENLSIAEHSEASFSLNERSHASETQSPNGAYADHIKIENSENDTQYRLPVGNHEGRLSAAKADPVALASKFIEEKTTSIDKEETLNAGKVENGAPINGAASIIGGRRKRTWHKSQGRSVDFAAKLKDLFPIDTTRDASEYMRYYDRWLRVGRFKDCIELLERMNRVGALDMNKVYHAKFFDICRKNRAVKEAFQFIKLIQNPSLSTFNMLLSVCASAEDVEGAFQVLPLVKKTGLKADCKLYTTLISSCAKGGKVDIMFKVFHEMVNAGVEPSVHTYGALIDGCARAGQVAKAFGVYGIMRSKKVKPDRVIFNALITACGRSGAVDRAFDVLSEMKAEPHPVHPDHVTVGALISACSQSGQVDRALEVYKMVEEYGIKGTPDVYTMAVSVCSQKGDLDFALGVYDDMKKTGVCPDEVFFSALIDAAGHAGNIDFAFQFLHDAKALGLTPGSVIYSSLMGACSNTRNWQRALELYEEIKAAKFLPTVSTVNALITSLCDAGNLQKCVEVLDEMKQAGVTPNQITYTILLIACQKEDGPELAFKLFSRATMDGVVPTLTMCDCVTGLCLRRFQKVSSLGQSIVSFDLGNAQIHNQWTSWALLVYRQTVAAGVVPTMEALSQVLGCLRMPVNAAQRVSLIESLGFNASTAKQSNLYSLIDGFGVYDPRAFSLYEEAASLGVVPCFSYKDNPMNVDAREMQVYAIEVYLLTILKGLKHRLAAGAQLPNITVRLPVEKVPVTSVKGQKVVSVSGRTGQVVGALLRRLNLPYQGNEAYGKIRISGKAIKHWLRPKSYSPSIQFSGKVLGSSSPVSHLAKSINEQQRTIRTEDLSFDQSTSSSIVDNPSDESSIKLYKPWEDRRPHQKF